MTRRDEWQPSSKRGVPSQTMATPWVRPVIQDQGIGVMSLAQTANVLSGQQATDRIWQASDPSKRHGATQTPMQDGSAPRVEAGDGHDCELIRRVTFMGVPDVEVSFVLHGIRIAEVRVWSRNARPVRKNGTPDEKHLAEH